MENILAWGEKWAKYQLAKVLPVKWPWQWSCLGFRRFHGWRTQKGLPNSSVIFWEQASSCSDTIPAFMWIHLPRDSTKAQKQRPVMSASREPSGQCVACQAHSLLLHPPELHPFLTAQQGTAIVGPSSVLYFYLCHECSPRVAERWWDTFSACQPSANWHHKGYRKLFWGAGYGQYISADTRTWMPSTWRRGKQPNWKLSGCPVSKRLSIQN